MMPISFDEAVEHVRDGGHDWDAVKWLADAYLALKPEYDALKLRVEGLETLARNVVQFVEGTMPGASLSGIEASLKDLADEARSLLAALGVKEKP
jgi:hypothetical protein